MISCETDTEIIGKVSTTLHPHSTPQNYRSVPAGAYCRAKNMSVRKSVLDSPLLEQRLANNLNNCYREQMAEILHQKSFKYSLIQQGE